MEPDLRDLLSAWLGTECEAPRYDELLARVRQDEAFRRAFVSEIRMLGMLKAVQSAEPRWLRLEDELGWSAAEQAAGETLEEGVKRRLYATRAPFRARTLGIFGAVLVILAGMAVLFRPRGLEVPRTTRSPVSKVDAASGLALVIKLDGVQWDGPQPSEGDLLAAGRFRFRSGRVTLSMLSGVMLVVEGPADVELVAIDRVFCRGGKLRTRVPEGAEGFVVSCPGSAVIDLGTEFALSLESDGKARVTVIEGEVEAAVLNAAGIPRRSQRMEQNKAFEIDPHSGEVSTIAEAGSVVAPADMVAMPLTLDPGYPSAVLASKPSHYWRFESLAAGVIPNEIPRQPPLLVTGPVRLTTTPGANQSVVFGPGETGQHLTMGGLWQPARGQGYAIELWFLPEAISHAALAGLFVPTDTKLLKHLCIVELTALTRQTLHPPDAVRFLHRSPPDKAGGVNVYSPERYIPYRWHHLVAQVNGERMELFLDGKLSQSAPVDADRSYQPGQLVLGRLSKIPIHLWWTSRPFVGRMDEVALYDHPITAQEVAHHYRLAKWRQ
jgi:Concanavalin A-like lectin/glucanases superfamily